MRIPILVFIGVVSVLFFSGVSLLLMEGEDTLVAAGALFYVFDWAVTIGIPVLVIYWFWQRRQKKARATRAAI